MLKNLNITIIQSDLYWENPEANLASFEEKIATISNSTDLIVLPEMFNTGFSMTYSEPANFKTEKWLVQMAERYNTHIMGSLAIKETNKKYNRLICANPKGVKVKYNKKNLFVLGDEQLSFSPGIDKIIVEIQNWKIQPLICFDLRFPEWSVNRKGKYDLLVYVASWPASRISAWRNLLVARAIENQCYVIGVNRLGTDGNEIKYNGQSLIIDFWGNIMFDATDKEISETVSLDYEGLQAFRKNYPFLLEE